jgi:hypothetical protein
MFSEDGGVGTVSSPSVRRTRSSRGTLPGATASTFFTLLTGRLRAAVRADVAFGFVFAVAAGLAFDACRVGFFAFLTARLRATPALRRFADEEAARRGRFPPGRAARLDRRGRLALAMAHVLTLEP